MRLLMTAVAAALVLGWPHPSNAQPLAQADASGSVGWLNGNGGPVAVDTWFHRSVYAGVDFGWYWTNHLKTQIEGGVGSKATVRTYESVIVDNRRATQFSRYEFTGSSLAIGQQYQFAENAMFHPFIGVGADFGWKKTREEDDPIFIDINTPIRPPVVHPVRRDLVVRPFGVLGFKAYATPRAFFKTDLKFMLRSGVDEVVLRFGVGVDF
jgi:hypothetical protein